MEEKAEGAVEEKEAEDWRWDDLFSREASES